MRVITGTARGRKQIATEGLDVRPTKDRVKEAIFSAIQFETEGVSCGQKSEFDKIHKAECSPRRL